MTRRKRISGFLMLTGLLCSVGAWAADETFPPPNREVSVDQPLFVFRAGSAEGDSQAFVSTVADRWRTLPDDLKPYSALLIDPRGTEPDGRLDRIAGILDTLRAAEVPVFVQIAGADIAHALSLAEIEAIVQANSNVRGLYADGLRFNDYAPASRPAHFGTAPEAQWLASALDTAARYGRYLMLNLDELGWPRLMANTWTAPVYDKMRRCRDYVIPIAPQSDAHAIPQQMAVMGLWLEGASANWGVGSDAAWFGHADYGGVGVFGSVETNRLMPTAFYRAMILNGAMCGATVYQFNSPGDLWFGSHPTAWNGAIAPTLREMVNKALIPKREFVRQKARIAYQLAPARTPEQFHFNQRDIDGLWDQGLLIHGAYGMERPGQVVELIPNSGRHYWVPILSPHAPPLALENFTQVVQAGAMSSPAHWTALLDQHYVPDAAGSAFVSRIGRGIYVLHTRENGYERQTFRIPGLPAPVRGAEARREENQVVLTWPFREGDAAYRVYKRLEADSPFVHVADVSDQRTWTDAAPAPEARYAVTALTSEIESYEGAVNYGDYLVFSAVESRIAEELVVTALGGTVAARPVEEAPDDRPETQTWWPNTEGLPADLMPVAEAIAERIVAWDNAFAAEQLDGVMDLYTTDYQDPEFWGYQYARRAYQWFFERYRACRMARQIRAWDFGKFDTDGTVRVLLYGRFKGVAISDATGHLADRPAWFPRTASGETWLTFTNKEGAWRIVAAEPGLPNFRDILSFSAGPYDAYPLGPDVYGR